MKSIKITEDCVIYYDENFIAKGQPKWHMSLFRRWREMWRRCKNPKHPQYENYKDCPIDDKYHYLYHYTTDIARLENFDKLCKEPRKWHIDKDKIDPDNRCYYFKHLSIITDKENGEERMNRGVDPNKSTRKAIQGISILDGSIITFSSMQDAKRNKFNNTYIRECIQGKRKEYKGYKWEYIDKEC